MKNDCGITEFLKRKSELSGAPDLNDFTILLNGFMNPITPEMVAEMFACMGSDEQAKFFNHVDEVATKWHDSEASLSFQLQAVTDEDGLNLTGRRVMDSIGEYSHWGLSYEY